MPEINNQQETASQSEIPAKKATVAQAVEAATKSPDYFSELEFSHSQHSELKQDYKALDSYLESEESTETVRENQSEFASENHAEPMTDDDIYFTASMGVGAATGLIESLVKAPVVIDDEAKANLVVKAAPVVKKYLGNGQMPSWLIKYKAEIDLAIAVGGVMFGVMQQVKAHKQKEAIKKANPDLEVKEVV